MRPWTSGRFVLETDTSSLTDHSEIFRITRYPHCSYEDALAPRQLHRTPSLFKAPPRLSSLDMGACGEPRRMQCTNLQYERAYHDFGTKNCRTPPAESSRFEWRGRASSQKSSQCRVRSVSGSSPSIECIPGFIQAPESEYSGENPTTSMWHAAAPRWRVMC